MFHPDIQRPGRRSIRGGHRHLYAARWNGCRGPHDCRCSRPVETSWDGHGRSRQASHPGLSGIYVPAERAVSDLEKNRDDLRYEGLLVSAEPNNWQARTKMSNAGFVTRRRFLIVGGSTLAALGSQSAWAQGQGRLRIESGEFQPMPIAIPAFVPGTPADGQA